MSDMKKGQMWTFDMALSLLIFFSALLTLLFAWGYINQGIGETTEIKSAQLMALTVSDSMIRTGGLPDGWNATSVRVIGLAYSQGILDPGRVGEFISLDHEKARILMGILPYDFYFEMRDINGTLYANTTVPVATNASYVIPVERYATYGGRIVKARFVFFA